MSMNKPNDPFGDDEWEQSWDIRSSRKKKIKGGIFIGIILLMSAIASWSMTTFVASSNRESPPGNSQLKEARVKVFKVQTGTVEDSSEFVASVESRRQASIKPPIEGQITRIFVTAGDTVAAGETIMELVSTKQQKQLHRFKILAPHAGMVDDIPVKEGELVNTSSQLTAIVQNQPLEVNISVYAERSSQLRKGMPVEIMDAQARSLGIAKVFFISPSVNYNSQTVLIKALFDNSKSELRTGQSTRARIIWGQRPGVLVPASAVARIAGENYVYVVQTSQKSPQGAFQFVARQKRVKLGNVKGTNYQVLEGLQSGERIIVSGLLNLRDGTPIIPES